MQILRYPQLPVHPIPPYAYDASPPSLPSHVHLRSARAPALHYLPCGGTDGGAVFPQTSSPKKDSHNSSENKWKWLSGIEMR